MALTGLIFISIIGAIVVLRFEKPCRFIREGRTYMDKIGKRIVFGRGRGYLSAAGPQSRFIMFLIFLLVAYTLLLRIFQKLAEIVQLPIFLPISLITLLVFIGIVGTLYSHKFVGPMTRIRRAIEQLAEGDTAVSLRLRESDDPMLKDLVQSISRLCEHSRNAHTLVQETARDLFAACRVLQEKIQHGSDANELRKQLDVISIKQDLLDKAIKALRKHGDNHG